MNADQIQWQIAGFLGASPYLAVLLVGAYFCIRRAWRHPRACLLTGIAIAIAVGSRVALPILSNLMFSSVFNNVQGLHDIHLRVFIQSLFYAIPTAASWGLLLWVIFGPDGYNVNPDAVWEDDDPKGSRVGS